MENGFAKDLARFGPRGAHPTPTLAEARAYCGQLARNHYENFSVASLLLPRRLIRPFHTVYAYCRWADDLADEVGGGQAALDLLGWWREELLRCYGGTPHHPVMVALRETIRQFQIPAQPFLDLLVAFEQDQRIQRYATYEEVLAYCRYSANPVGHLVLYLCQAYTPENARLADDVCTGLQLANFWQDVARDYDIGRVYLPHEDLERFGIPEADLAARRFTPAFAELMCLEVERARRLFENGLPLIERMPAEVQADIELFIQGGLAILRKIEQQGYNVLHGRPALAKWEKLTLISRVLWKKMTASLPLPSSRRLRQS